MFVCVSPGYIFYMMDIIFQSQGYGAPWNVSLVMLVNVMLIKRMCTPIHLDVVNLSLERFYKGLNLMTRTGKTETEFNLSIQSLAL